MARIRHRLRSEMFQCGTQRMGVDGVHWRAVDHLPEAIRGVEERRGLCIPGTCWGLGRSSWSRASWTDGNMLVRNWRLSLAEIQRGVDAGRGRSGVSNGLRLNHSGGHRDQAVPEILGVCLMPDLYRQCLAQYCFITFFEAVPVMMELCASLIRCALTISY